MSGCQNSCVVRPGDVVRSAGAGTPDIAFECVLAGGDVALTGVVLAARPRRGGVTDLPAIDGARPEGLRRKERGSAWSIRLSGSPGDRAGAAGRTAFLPLGAFYFLLSARGPVRPRATIWAGARRAAGLPDVFPPLPYIRRLHSRPRLLLSAGPICSISGSSARNC